MDRSYVVEIENLTKTYGKYRGVDGISLKIRDGDIFGFLGPNGAGKSTTIRSLLGLIKYQKGKVFVLGMDVTKQSKEILKEVGYIPAEAMFYPSMKVKEIISFAAKMRGKNCKKEAEMLCERLGLDTEKKIEELSLGNRKKVSIVCAMQHKPRLFIFDEPTSGLDPLVQAEFFKLILEYHEQGTACFLSSHVLSEVKKYCHHVAIIKEGKLICTDTIENLTKTSAKRVCVVKDGIEENYVYKGDLNQLFAGFAGHNISDIVIEEPELDEIFLHFYDGEEERI